MLPYSGMHTMENPIDFVTTRSKWVVIAVLLASLPFVYLYTQQRFQNDLYVFFSQDDPEMKAYRAFQEQYGNDEVALIIVSDANIFSEKTIGIVKSISALLNQHESVQRVFSITEEEEPVGENDTIEFRKIIKEGPIDPREMAAIRKKVLSDDLLVKNLVSTDGTSAIILMELKGFSGDQQRHTVLSDIKKQALAIAAGRVGLRFSGLYIDDEMYSLSQQDYRLFTPVTILIIFLVAAFLLRSILPAVLCLFTLSLILAWSMGIFTLYGESINMVTTIIAPVLLAVSIADAIHFLFHYQDSFYLKDQSHPVAVKSTLEAVWLPCCFTSLTTAIGFFSFVFSSVRPPRIVGIFTAIGVIIALLLTLTFLPATLLLMRGWFEKIKARKSAGTKGKNRHAVAGPKDRFQDMLLSIGRFTIAHDNAIRAFFFVILILSGIGILKIRFETSISSYLPDHSPAKIDLDFLRDTFGGYAGIEVLLKAKTEDFDFTQPESLELADRIKQSLLQQLELTSTLSIADYFKKMNRAFNENRDIFYRIPQNRRDVVDFYELGDPEILDRIVSQDRMETRISFRFLWSSTEKAKIMLDRMESLLKQMELPHHTATLNGQNKLYILMESNLKSSQLKSLLSALVLIFITMFFICRNIKLALLSLIPNLFPIAVTLGIMGWCDIPLNVTNIMIASVTIGIAVDDTIHFITWFRRHSIAGMDREKALLQTFKDVGKPLVTTTVVLCLGFFVLLLGTITPTKTFGLLAGISLFLALLADLFFLPPLILLFKPHITGDRESG